MGCYLLDDWQPVYEWGKMARLDRYPVMSNLFASVLVELEYRIRHSCYYMYH